MRVAVGMVGVETHLIQHLQHNLLAFTAVAQAVNFQAFGNRFAHGNARVERGIGVLKDDLHVAAQRLKIAAALGKNIFAIKEDRTGRGGL